jgi:hypothetical protein
MGQMFWRRLQDGANLIDDGEGSPMVQFKRIFRLNDFQR